MVDANFNLNGAPLDFGEQELLNGSDITFIDGQYVMQTQQFRRSRNNPNVIVASNQRSVIFQSAAPFGPGRVWNGTRVNRIWPRWIKMGSRLLSVVDAAWSSSNGINWTNVDASVAPQSLSVGRAMADALTAGGKLVLIEYRAEDPSVPIKRLHKMSEAQSILEMEAIGLDHVGTEDFLPQQHFMVFEKSRQATFDRCPN